MSDIILEPIEKFGLSKKIRPKAMFSKIGVVGAGVAGQNIARIASSRGIEVVLLDLDEEKVNAGIKDIDNQLDDMIGHWGMTPGEKRGILSRLKGTSKYSDFQGCDLVIEAILTKEFERRNDVRTNIFRTIEKYVDSHAILATNSSSVDLTALASELKYNNRCICVHFTSVVPGSKIVELTYSLTTSDDVKKNIEKFIKMINQEAIAIEESPGMVSPRLLAVLVNEACRTLMEGVSNIFEVDKIMREGIGLQLGPFEMADKIGLDRIVRWMENLYSEYGDLKYKASPYLKRLVRARQLGRKSGKGFYSYNSIGDKIID